MPLKIRVAVEFLARCNINYKIAFSQWRQFFRQRFVKQHYLEDIIEECTADKVRVLLAQDLMWNQTRKKMKDFFIKTHNHMTLKKIANEYLPDGVIDDYIAKLQGGSGSPHLVNAFKEISWPEPIDKGE